jgi:predicted Zn-dependent peptidase
MITTTQLANGLTVIVEEMDHVESVSYDMLIPGGLVVDETSTVGASLILAELLGRGAGEMDARQLSSAFDAAGIRHGEGVGMDRFSLSGSLVADKLERALELLSCMVRNASLPEGEIESIQSVMQQDIAALNDNPARKSMVELTKRYYPQPFNRSSLGEAEGINASTRETVAGLYSRYFVPQRAILSIAGNVKAARVLEWVERYLGSWSGSATTLPEFGSLTPPAYYPLEVESAQLQIVMAAPSVKFAEAGYYDGKIAISILGASMFGRLFVEVREKRGLCYSVYARHGATASYGTVSAYVGTTPERAQESLDVLLREFEGLRGTVTPDELARAKTNLKATLVMGEESPGSRAASNGGDWWLLKRIRSLQEIATAIDAVSLDSIDAFLAKYPFRPCSLLTLGSRSREVPSDVVG